MKYQKILNECKNHIKPEIRLLINLKLLGNVYNLFNSHSHAYNTHSHLTSELKELLNAFNYYFDSFIIDMEYIKKDIPETNTSKIEKLKHCATLILNIVKSFLKLYKFGIDELVKILLYEFPNNINKITIITENIKYLIDIEFDKIISLFTML